MATLMNGTVFTVADAAHFLKLDTSMVSRYCRDGRIKARKIGRDWVIAKTDLVAFSKEPREPGNPTFRKS